MLLTSHRRISPLPPPLIIILESLLCVTDVTPLLCIGESLKEYGNGETYNVCIDEIDKAFIGNDNLDKIIVVYEPIWAIGSGTTPTVDFIENHVTRIKKYVNNKYGFDIKVLYGGSVGEDNFQQLSRISTIDGFLVGGNSLNIDVVKKMININKGV